MINPPIYRLTTAVSDIDQTNINRDIRDGNWLSRDNTWLVGDTLTWADLHLFFFCSEDFLEPKVVAAYPKIAKLVGKVGEVPSIKRWVETRPGNKEMFPGKRIYFQNAYKIVESLE